jgi:DNA-directed RNA polymerase sigma subunit (sigma70/sigma32)
MIRPTNQELKIRARAIFKSFISGATTAELSSVYNLSRERIRQILEKEKRILKRKFYNSHEEYERIVDELLDRDPYEIPEFRQ